MPRLADFVLRHSRALLLLWLAAFLGGLTQLPRIRIENSFRHLIEDNVQPELVRSFEETLETFGSDRIIQVGLKPGGSVFAPDFLSWLDETTRAIESWPDVERVTSLANARIVEADSDEIRVAPLIGSLPSTAAQSEALARRAAGSRLLKRVLIDDEGRATALMIDVKVRREIESERYVNALVGQVRDRIAERFTEGESFFLSGGPALTEGMARGSRRDWKLYLIGPVLLVAGLLGMLFRNPAATLLPNLAVWLSAAIALGLAARMAPQFDMLTLMLPVLILTIAIADVIHMITFYHEELARGADRAQAVHAMVRTIGPPCFLTSLTTAIGFGSFALSPLPMLRRFGWESGLAVMIAWLVAMTFVPSALLRLPVPRIDRDRLHRRGGMGRILGRIAQIVFRRPGWIFGGFALVSAVSLYGMTRLEYETSFREYFDEDSDVRRAFAFNDHNLMGSAPLVVVLKGAPDAFRKIGNLTRADAIAEFLAEEPKVRKVIGISDPLKELHRAVQGGGAEHYRLPDTDAQLAGLLLLAESGDGLGLEKMVNFDYSQLRLSAMCVDVNTAVIEGIMHRLEAFLAERDMGSLTVETTGTVALSVRMAVDLMDAQMQSIFGAAVLIGLVMVLLIGSAKTGLLSLLPNLAPIFMTLGLMGFFGISLNISTVMVASVALGIAVDDTIHFLTRFIREFGKDGDYRAAAERSLLGVGRAMVFTSVVLTGGFGILVFSSLRPPQEFGLFTALAIVLALAADLLLTPALIVHLRPPIRAGWASRLPEDPTG